MKYAATEHDVPKLAEHYEIVPSAIAPQYTPDNDVRALAWLAKRTSGNVVELGCNKGFTTANLAYHCPDKTIYGIDSSVNKCKEQVIERPSADDIGIAAKSFFNAHCLNMPSESINYEDLDRVSMVFIDADHTYEGCKRDTERALQWLQYSSERRKILAWHDYATEYMTGHPEWLRVGEYVRKEIAPNHTVNFFRRTTLAWVEWMDKPKVAIGVVTFNRLDLLKRCLPSWLTECNDVYVFDNGSDNDTTLWLSTQPVHLIRSPVNEGVSVGRNRILERLRGQYDYVLLIDSDVELQEGCVDQMVQAAEWAPDAGCVIGYQACRDYMPDEFGRVPEAAGEAMLVRVEAIKEIGGFPESLVYYSSDSWWFLRASMLGWWTICTDARYEHHQHGSQGIAGVTDAARRDIALWSRRERAMERFWAARMTYGKGVLSTPS